jgi:hypothetical protein
MERDDDSQKYVHCRVNMPAALPSVQLSGIYKLIFIT